MGANASPLPRWGWRRRWATLPGHIGAGDGGDVTVAIVVIVVADVIVVYRRGEDTVLFVKRQFPAPRERETRVSEKMDEDTGRPGEQ